MSGFCLRTQHGSLNISSGMKEYKAGIDAAAGEYAQLDAISFVRKNVCTKKHLCQVNAAML
jgi:hypothetical protein